MQIHFSQIPEIKELQEKVLALGNFLTHDPDNETYNEAQQIFVPEPRDNGGE